MADQRSSFRFRVPRLRPSVPPPRPTPTSTTTRTPPRKPPVPSPPPPVTPPAPPPSPASPPPLSTRPQGTTPDQPPPPPPLVILPSPSPAPAPLPQAAPPPPTTIQSLNTVPAPLPSPPPQDQLASMAPIPVQAAPPSTRSKPTPQPASPPTSPQPNTQNTPEVKRSTEIPSDSSQKGTDNPLDTTHPDEERNEQTSMELSSEHSNSESHIKEKPRIKAQKTDENQHEHQEAIITDSNIPKTPQTKSMISQPDDKIPVPESPENLKPNGTNQFLNEKAASVITLAGDNRGTSMHIGSGATKQEKSIHIRRRYKVNPDEITDSITDAEEKENDFEADQEHERSAYINCNIQGFNNSIMFNCYITEKNPGVHLGSCNPNKPKRKYIRSMDLKKVKVNTSPSQKHTIRRRCLRGLFMESSESDTNDPQKPRRHGCRYVCEDKSNKDDNVDL